MYLLKKYKVSITQDKFYLILILILLFISFQLDGINDKLNMLIQLASD